MKTTKSLIIIAIIAGLSGCAGRAANPVALNQLGDESKSCRQIKTELMTVENNIQRLIPQSDKTARNVALGVAGLVVWPAWLFMDLSNAEKEELHAYRARHDKLVALAERKNCTDCIASASRV